MYRQTDRTSAIKHIQIMLGINASGVYDKSTRDAVIHLQSNVGISESGVVDFETFTAIKDAYQRENVRRRINSTYPYLKFPYVYGDYSNELQRINEDISRAVSRYTYEGFSPSGKGFNTDTVNAVRRLRSVYSMEQNDLVDESLYDRISCDILMK